MTSNQPERLHALDAVRGGALLLGVAFHATMSFLPGQQVWVVMDAERSAVMSVLFFWLHMFRMAAFFLIAGFFGRMLLERRGLTGFLADRGRRIALPLVVFWPVLFTAIVAVMIWAAVKANGGAAPSGPAPGFPSLPNFPLTHLWFLYVLLIFYAAALLVRGVLRLLDPAEAAAAVADRVMRWMVELWLPVMFAAPLAFAFWSDPTWLAWFGIMTPDSSLIPNVPALVGYGTAFAAGWLLHRQPGLLQVWTERWPMLLGVGLGCVSTCLVMVGLEPALTPTPLGLSKFAYACLYATGVFCWTFGLVGAAQQFLSGCSPARRYVADASYWIYLIHVPVVMALQTVVSDLAWPWPAKYALVLGAALAIGFASYQLLVRGTVLGGWLNGRRHKRLAKGRGLVHAEATGDTP